MSEMLKSSKTREFWLLEHPTPPKILPPCVGRTDPKALLAASGASLCHMSGPRTLIPNHFWRVFRETLLLSKMDRRQTLTQLSWPLDTSTTCHSWMSRLDWKLLMCRIQQAYSSVFSGNRTHNSCILVCPLRLTPCQCSMLKHSMLVTQCLEKSSFLKQVRDKPILTHGWRGKGKLMVPWKVSSPSRALTSKTWSTPLTIQSGTSRQSTSCGCNGELTKRKTFCVSETNRMSAFTPELNPRLQQPLGQSNSTSPTRASSRTSKHEYLADLFLIKINSYFRYH